MLSNVGDQNRILYENSPKGSRDRKKVRPKTANPKINRRQPSIILQEVREEFNVSSGIIKECDIQTYNNQTITEVEESPPP